MAGSSEIYKPSMLYPPPASTTTEIREKQSRRTVGLFFTLFHVCDEFPLSLTLATDTLKFSLYTSSMFVDVYAFIHTST